MTLPATRREDETPHVTDLDADTLAKLVADGDCKRLTAEQRVAYYRARCEAAGLDYRAQPFEFLTLNGKLVLYAKREAANQLASNHGIRCEITDQRTEQEMRVVTVRAIAKDGRQTDEIGVVNIANQKGDNLANAYMKAVTKAKRRAVLSVCGLGMLDETELETVPGARPDGAAPPALVPPRRKSEQVEPPPPAEVINAQRAAIDRMDTSAAGAEPAEILGEEEPHDAMTRTLTQDEIASLMGLVGQSRRAVPEFNTFLKTTFKIKSRKDIQFGWLPEISTWLAAGE